MTCTKCHENEAEWFGLFVDDLCQECFEAWCKMNFGKPLTKEGLYD